MKALLCTAALVAASFAAQAGESFVGAGSTGLELGYAFKLRDTVGLRADAGFLSYGRDFGNNGADYNAKVKLSALGLYGDWFVAGGSFRLTGGLVLGTRKVEGTGVSNGGTVTINGTAYPIAAGESVRVDAKFPDASPYLGIGWGHAQQSAGLGFYLDAGAVFGKPKATLEVSPGILAAAGQGNVDAERANVQDKLDGLRAYPVIKLGVTYRY